MQCSQLDGANTLYEPAVTELKQVCEISEISKCKFDEIIPKNFQRPIIQKKKSIFSDFQNSNFARKPKR